MKRILFPVLVVLLVGCTKWEVLSPINEEVTVTLLNVYITFDYDTPQLITLNENFGRARVIVSRRVDDCWADYTEIFNRRVPGKTEISEKAYFCSGDKIRIHVTVFNLEDDDPERWTYFQLGKQAVAALIFPDQPDFRDFEISAGPDGSVILEFPLN